MSWWLSWTLPVLDWMAYRDSALVLGPSSFMSGVLYGVLAGSSRATTSTSFGYFLPYGGPHVPWTTYVPGPGQLYVRGSPDLTATSV